MNGNSTSNNINSSTERRRRHRRKREQPSDADDPSGNNDDERTFSDYLISHHDVLQCLIYLTMSDRNLNLNDVCKR